jgi:hypothetical protein
MSRRSDYKPKFEMPFWKADGKFWYAEKGDLEAAIKRSCRTEEDLTKRLGAGFHYLKDLLDGKRLDNWAILHVEFGIKPECEITYLPLPGTSSSRKKDHET